MKKITIEFSHSQVAALKAFIEHLNPQDCSIIMAQSMESPSAAFDALKRIKSYL